MELKDVCKPDKFDELANKLINEYVLAIGNRVFRLEEIEMYYYSDDHKDEYSEFIDKEYRYMAY